MKNHFCKLMSTVVCLTLLLLCACSYGSKIVGTWSGDGTLDIKGMHAPFEFATQWVFRTDGTAVVTVGEEEIKFKYSMTDDTLTLNGEELTWGIYNGPVDSDHEFENEREHGMIEKIHKRRRLPCDTDDTQLSTKQRSCWRFSRARRRLAKSRLRTT